MCCLSLRPHMSRNVSGFLAFAKRITVCCSIFKSHLYKPNRISGFCKTYHHVLSIFKSNVYKGQKDFWILQNVSPCVVYLASLMSTNVAGFLDFAKCMNMCCLSFSLMSTNVAGFLASAKRINDVVSIFRSHVYKPSRISGFCKTYHHALSTLRPHVYKGSRTSGFRKTDHNVLDFWILQNVSPSIVYL